MISIKIHNSYRTVVALCDSNLLNKKFEEGNRQLDLRQSFYREEEKNFDTIVKILEIQAGEDSTFNIVGEESIKAALKAGIISRNSIDYICKIPFALKLI